MVVQPALRAAFEAGLCCLLLTATLAAPSRSAEVDLTATTFDGFQLAGTLHLPEVRTKPSRVPVVIFTHGSGPDTRPGYRRWVEPFTTEGIGVLVFDKRGCGESTGTYVEAPDLDVPAGDVIAWLNLIRQRDDVDSSHIGVMGWSQGGWVGPLAASRDEGISFVVSISGPGVSPFEQNVFDKTNQCRATGATPEQTAEFEQVIRSVWGYIVTGQGREEAQARWDRVVDEPWFSKAYNGAPMMDRDRLLKDQRMHSYVEHSSYEPAPVLESLGVPMLAVFGEEDSAVPVEASVRAMTEAFRRAGNPKLTVFREPGGDHGIRVTGPGGRRTLHPDYPQKVVDWVVEQVFGD